MFKNSIDQSPKFLSTPREEEGDKVSARVGFLQPHGFLSTPSVKRATLHLWPVLRSIRHFYPRPP